MATRYFKLAIQTVVAGAALALIGQWGQHRLPAVANLANPGAVTPEQTAVDLPPIEFNFENKAYKLTPRARYKLEGLIVSQHRSDSIFDLMHARTGDYLNSRDFCTVWGDMLKSGLYRDMKFTSGDWTCYFSAASYQIFNRAKLDEIANNHILVKDEKTRRAIEKLELGDEVRIQGMLVDYDIDGSPMRRTSLVRTDTGNGACETLYVESVEVLVSHNRWFKYLRQAGTWIFLFGVFAMIAIMIKTVFLPQR